MQPASDGSGVVIRNAVPTDLNYIRRTWLTGLRDAPNGLPDQFWWPAHRGYVESRLGDAAFSVVIAAAADDPHEILGYAVASKDVLEWVYVRKGLRSRGLAGELLRAVGVRPGIDSRWHPPRNLRLSYRPRELRRSL